MTAATRIRRDTRGWPVLLLAAPAFVAIWSGWVGLGELAGFGVVRPLPGIWDEAKLNTAITLPIGVEAYAAYAIHVALSGQVPAAARRFARFSAVGALILGALGQVAYHLLRVESDAKTAEALKGVTDPKAIADAYTAAEAALAGSAPTAVVVAVACLPVVVLGMGAALAHLIRSAPDLVQQPERTSPPEVHGPVLPAVAVDRSNLVPGGPVLAIEVDQSTGLPEEDRPDRSTGTAQKDQSTDQSSAVRRTTRISRPRTTRKTSPKVRSIETGTEARMRKLRTEYPHSVPSNGDIKKTLGIRSQGTADKLRKALTAERAETRKEAVQ